MRKIGFVILALLFLLPCMAETSYTLVIDAGHGGKDPGAVGKFSKEKDLNLKLALAVGKLINEQYPDVKVVYTRSTDVFIPLQERADIANKNNADLFLSIHTNSSESKDPRGVETFILGTEKMDKNLDVAMRENAVIKLEADYKTTYQGFDPNSIDSYIMFELMQNSYMDQSLQFAEQVQSRFVGHLNREDRGVRQAAFWVLLKTACPSVLFEMGFISNPEEERFLNQNTSIAQMANALVNAFGAYTHKQAVKKETLVIESSQPQTTSNEVQQPQTTSNEVQQAQTTSNEVQQPQTTTYYAVQICASHTPLAPDDPKLKGQACESVQVGEWHKYYTAADTDRNKVVEAQKRLKTLFPDCWIIKIEK
jgi:N-acetylmuramoyl-L-alanine amidase